MSLRGPEIWRKDRLKPVFLILKNFSKSWSCYSNPEKVFAFVRFFMKNVYAIISIIKRCIYIFKIVRRGRPYEKRKENKRCM